MLAVAVMAKLSGDSAENVAAIASSQGIKPLVWLFAAQARHTEGDPRQGVQVGKFVALRYHGTTLELLIITGDRTVRVHVRVAVGVVLLQNRLYPLLLSAASLRVWQSQGRAGD